MSHTSPSAPARSNGATRYWPGGSQYPDIRRSEGHRSSVRTWSTTARMARQVSPTLSALVVARAREGRRSRWRASISPGIIVDSSRSTTARPSLQFFYYRAMECGGAPLESQFRYEGLSRIAEVGIVMLADTSRPRRAAEREPTKEHITDTCDRLSRRRCDGQLDGVRPDAARSGARVKSSFIRHSRGMLHSRIGVSDLSGCVGGKRRKLIPIASKRITDDHNES